LPALLLAGAVSRLTSEEWCASALGNGEGLALLLLLCRLSASVLGFRLASGKFPAKFRSGIRILRTDQDSLPAPFLWQSLKRCKPLREISLSLVRVVTEVTMGPVRKFSLSLKSGFEVGVRPGSAGLSIRAIDSSYLKLGVRMQKGCAIFSGRRSGAQGAHLRITAKLFLLDRAPCLLPLERHV
jgi:hypothetical protein